MSIWVIVFFHRQHTLTLPCVFPTSFPLSLTCTHTHTQIYTYAHVLCTYVPCLHTLSIGLPPLGTQKESLLTTGSTTTSNTMSPTNSESGSAMGTNELPLALILSCSLVGISCLIVVIMIIFVIAACVSRRKTYVVSSSATPNSNKQTRHYDPTEEDLPVYAQINKHDSDNTDGLASPTRTLHSPPTEESIISNGMGIASEPQPREILAFSSVPRQGFRPFPPPPHVAGWLNQNDLGQPNWDTYSYTPGPLDSYDATSDASSVLSSVRPMERSQYWQNTWHPSESYYDRPEVLHEDVMSSLNSSMLHVPHTISAQVSLPEGIYQVPNSQPATLPRKLENSRSKYNHTYSEQLEPSMFQMLTSSIDQSSQALPYAPIYDCPRSLKKSEEPLEISRQNIVEIRDLGFGHFGRVVLAATTKLSLKELRLGDSSDRNCSLLVAIKKLREDADVTLKDAFQSEIKFMSRLKHANVVRLLGVCTSISDNEPFMMMEYMENGDLHEFLQKQTLVPDTINKLEDNHVTPLILLYITVQIANGMRYLASKKFVHRDLATRNCLVGRDFVVKISDFGMSRNLYESFYYRVQGRLILPIRWMAYESFYGKFSVKSDAWSFGVTVWEIYTLGKSEPYDEMSDEEYINDAVRGAERTILSQPIDCPDTVYEVMMRCFVHDPTMRADFEEVYSRLFLTYTKLGKLSNK